MKIQQSRNRIYIIKNLISIFTCSQNNIKYIKSQVYKYIFRFNNKPSILVYDIK